MKTRSLSSGLYQRGATLIVALVMLVLMTLLAVTAISLSTGNLKIVGNMQYQQEAAGAAQAAINQVLSRELFFVEPDKAPANLVVNVNGHDYTVQLARPCMRSATTLSISDLTQLSFSPAQIARCRSSSTVVNSGILGQNLGNAPSDCARVIWEVTATVNDASTNANVSLVEGATITMDRLVADAYKNDAAMRCS